MLQKPDFARARPSTLLTDDVAYNKLYCDNQNLSTFYIAAYIGKKVDNVLKACGEYSSSQKSDILFYVVYVVAARLVGKELISSSDLSVLDMDKVNEELILECAKWVYEQYMELGGTDKIAKGTELTQKVKTSLGKDFEHTF